jgi:hypothetical protein
LNSDSPLTLSLAHFMNGHWECYCGQVVNDDDYGRRCRGCEDDGDMVQVTFVPTGRGETNKHIVVV